MILAQLVDQTSHVEAHETDLDAPIKARDNLSDRANVAVINLSGSAPGLLISDKTSMPAHLGSSPLA